MKWVTRERPKTDRIIWPWLIRKFHLSRASTRGHLRALR